MKSRCITFGEERDPVFFLGTGRIRRPRATSSSATGPAPATRAGATTTATSVQGRADDVIKSAGYRIGPAEIETCLVKHPAVANAAVIGKPDAVRGSIVKAFIVLQPGFSGNENLIEEIQQHVRGRLAPYEYPREIEFIDALPMTTTGKVQRKELRKREEAKPKA